MKQNVYFVSGIDTDAGKSYATGFLAREWNKNGQRTITQKFIQTGNVGHSEDIDLHRHIMGIPFTEEDKEGLTMPGVILKTYVKKGDSVKRGDPLCVLVAMKMENEIRAVTDGVVKEVFIEDNMKVGLNDRIMVIE